MVPSERVYERQTIKRPVILTIICILGILGSLVGFIYVFSPYVRKIGDWVPAIYGIIIAIKFISLVGVWHMKKWGVHLFLCSFFSDIIFAMLSSGINYFALVFSIIFIIFFLIYYRRMDDEL